MNCYKFESKEHFRTLAAAEGLVNEDGDLILCSHTHSLDEVGIILRGGEWDMETGETITPPTILNGWHVNAKGIAPPAWDQFLCIVNNPARVFLGGATQAPATEILEEIAAL